MYNICQYIRVRKARTWDPSPVLTITVAVVADGNQLPSIARSPEAGHSTTDHATPNVDRYHALVRPALLLVRATNPDSPSRPHLREQLIYDMNWETDFERFRTIHNQCVSVNWPYPLADILVSNSNNEISLNPLFEEHIRNLGNWSVGPELAQEFPYARSIPQHPVRDEQVT